MTSKNKSRPEEQKQISPKALIHLAFRDNLTSKQKSVSLELRRGLRPRIRSKSRKDPLLRIFYIFSDYKE